MGDTRKMLDAHAAPLAQETIDRVGGDGSEAFYLLLAAATLIGRRAPRYIRRLFVASLRLTADQIETLQSAASEGDIEP